MRSSDLARISGVTVRALRHYHRVGILGEPSRRSNGYREYDVHDLIRVLRIRRLASLGIPLERMPALLDDEPADSAEILDALDTELAAQIDRLQRQRRTIKNLRMHNAAPDLPPELAPFLSVFAMGLSPRLERFDREQSVLLAHLVGDDGLAYLTTFYQRISESGQANEITALTERFDALGPESSEEDLDAVIDGFLAFFDNTITGLPEAAPPVDISDSADLVAAHTAAILNTQQRLALEEVERRLGAATDTPI